MKIITFIFSCLLLQGIFAQRFSIDANYCWIMNKQFDKAMQVYNQRPFLTQKQPLFRNGFGVGFTFEKTVKESKFCLGGKLAYAYFESYSENQDFINDLQLHVLSPQFIGSYFFSKNLQTECTIGIPFYGMFRQINNEPISNDGTPVRAFGVGFSFGTKVYCGFKFSNGISLHPFIGIDYCPLQYSPNGETLINQTKGLYTTNYNSFLQVEAGLKCSFQK